MGSNRLFCSLLHGNISGQASRGYTCTEKYEWQNLTLRQIEHKAREQHVPTQNCPVHTSRRERIEVSATEISHPSQGGYGTVRKTMGDINCAITMSGVKRMGENFASHEIGNSSKIHGNGFGGPCHLSSCSYGGRYGQDHACLSHSSKRVRRSISPGPDPVRPDRSERSPSFEPVRHYAKGVERQTRQAVSFKRNFRVNLGSGSQKTRYYHKDRYQPSEVDFPNGHFSDIDAAKGRSYVHNVCAYSKLESREDPMSQDRTLHGQLWKSDVARAHNKRPIYKFRAIQLEQLELSPSKDFHERLDSSQNCRNACKGTVLNRKYTKQGFHGSTFKGGFASAHGRNNSQKRNADQLGGKKSSKYLTYEDKSKTSCHPSEKDQRLPVGCSKIRNDSQEENSETAKIVGQNEAKGNCNEEKNAPTASASNIPTKSDENLTILSPEYSSKMIASSNGPKRNEGSIQVEPKSDKQSNVDGGNGRGTLQHLPVTMKKRVNQKESSHSEVLRDCLNIWRRLRKDNGAEADKTVNSDQQQTLQTNRVSVGGRVTNVRAAACGSSESGDEHDSELDSSEFSSTAVSSEGLKKSGEGRVNRKLECLLTYPSSHKCNKRPHSTTSEKRPMCDLELPPEANIGEIIQQKEQDHPLTDYPDPKVQTTQYGCSDTSQAAVCHCDNSAHHNVSQQKAGNDNLVERRKDKLGVSCEIESKIECGGVKLAEKITSLCTGPTLLDQKNVSRCSMHDNSKRNASEILNHNSKSATITKSILDRGTDTRCQKKPVNGSSGSYCRDVENLLNVDDNSLRKKQECSLQANSENEMNHEAAKEDYQEAQVLEFGITSDKQVSLHYASGTVSSAATNQGDRAHNSLLPDLNCLPSIGGDEYFIAFENLVCEEADGFKHQCVTKSFSGSLTGPVMEEQFKQTEPNHIVREACEMETSESANQLLISDSNTGPRQVSTVDKCSTATDAFKFALCGFMRNILKPLWEDGLLSREVHKLIMNKAAAKVIGALGPKVPSTEMAISNFISDPNESRNLAKLVQGYLDVYVGKQILKRIIPGSS